MASQSSSYHSYLLRLWRDDESSPWRIQLENPHTGERRSFPTMAQMIEFLDRRMDEVYPDSSMEVASKMD